MNPKYQPFFVGFFTAVPMCAVLVGYSIFRQQGFFPGFFEAWFYATISVLPLAYVCAIVFSWLARNIVSKFPWRGHV